MTLKFDGWRWKTIRHLFYGTSSCVHRFTARVTVRKRPIRVKFGDFLSHVTLEVDGWPWKTIEHLCYAISSFVYHLVAIGKFKLELQPEMTNSGQIRRFFVTSDLEIWQMTLKNHRAPLLCMLLQALCIISQPSVNSNLSYSPARKHPIWVKIGDFFVRCDLEIWRMTLKSNRAPLLHNFKLCALFRSHL